MEVTDLRPDVPVSAGVTGGGSRRSRGGSPSWRARASNVRDYPDIWVWRFQLVNTVIYRRYAHCSPEEQAGRGGNKGASKLCDGPDAGPRPRPGARMHFEGVSRKKGRRLRPLKAEPLAPVTGQPRFGAAWGGAPRPNQRGPLSNDISLELLVVSGLGKAAPFWVDLSEGKKLATSREGGTAAADAMGRTAAAHGSPPSARPASPRPTGLRRSA